MSYSPEIRKLFEGWKQAELLQHLESSHQQLMDRRKADIEYGEPDALTPKKRALLNCQLLQQVLLHRAECLLSSSGTLLLGNDIYGVALLVRGQCEATAVLGYFCHRLESLANGNITFDVFEWNVADAVMGAKHELFTEARPPLNVLTCIEKADKYLEKHLFKGKTEKKAILKDMYDWLSDFAHPNFLSNSTAITLDKQSYRFIFRHGSDLQERDFELLGYLDVSSSLFVFLFDEFARRINDGCLAE